MIHCKHLTPQPPYVGLELNKINIFVLTRCEVFVSSVQRPFCSTVSDCFPEISRVLIFFLLLFVCISVVTLLQKWGFYAAVC